jgi:signal peptidase I
MDDQDDPGTLASARTSEPASAEADPEDEAARSDQLRQGGRRSGKKKSFWRELLTIVVAAAVLTLVVKGFVVQVYRIPSASMENTLQIGDRVLVNKLIYHFRGIARGDIVVFSGQDSWGPPAAPPSSDPVLRVFDDVLSDIGLHSSQTYYIKRVIGLPGDKVACCTDLKVTVNGVPLNEGSYVYPGNAPSAFSFKTTVPAGYVWVMGDHRGDSEDSRYHTDELGGGAVPENEVVGRAFLVIWPPSQFRDLPIPSTFTQAALHAVAAHPVRERTCGNRRRGHRRPLAAPVAAATGRRRRSGRPKGGVRPAADGTGAPARQPHGSAMGIPGFCLRRDLSRPGLNGRRLRPAQLPVNRLLTDRDSCAIGRNKNSVGNCGAI